MAVGWPRAYEYSSVSCRDVSSRRQDGGNHLAKSVSSYLAFSSKVRQHEALGRKRPFVLHRADRRLVRS
jgi:hypothetical protein